MTEQVKTRACRALCWNNEQHPLFDCVWVVANHICFQEYVAVAWWKELSREYPIEVISYKDAQIYLLEAKAEALGKSLLKF